MPAVTTLSIEDRMDLFSSFQRFGGEYGYVSELAREWDVSRTFVYDLARRVRASIAPERAGRRARDRRQETIEALELRVGHLEADCETLRGELALEQMDRRDRRFRLIMELALAPVSVEKISRCLEAATGERVSGSRIADVIEQAGEAALRLMQREEVRGALRDVALDEIFTAKKPVLTLVEPNALMAVVPERTPDRTGETWRGVLDQYPNLEFAVSDQGSGLLKGIELRGRHIARQADLFHVKRALGREARRLEAGCYRAIERVDEARSLIDEPGRTWTARLVAVDEYRRAAAELDRRLLAFDWYEVVLKYLDEQLEVWDAREDRVRTAESARCGIEEVLGLLAEIDAIETGPTRAILEGVKYELVTFLRVLAERLRRVRIDWAVVPGSRETVLRAMARAWYWRRRARHHEEDRRRYLLALAALEHARRRIVNYREVIKAVFAALDGVVRASSAVECLNSIVRPYAAIKKRLTPRFLALIALYWDMKPLPKRGGRTPFEIMGVNLGTKDWVEALELEIARMRSERPRPA